MNNLFLSYITILAVGCFILSHATNSEFDGGIVGFGLQRLKKHGSKVLLQKQSNVGSSCDNSIEYWYKDAIVDNFATSNEQQTWAGQGQRYWINQEFWGGHSYPIFVFIGGEGQEQCTRLTSYLYFYSLAQTHKAMMVDIEHRFYGQSYPTNDMSTTNLKYLSSDQALADLARLIGHIKDTYITKESKVITFGGSYPGNLAAWFRLKYPSVTQGSIASSAPLDAKLNFYEYMEVVGQAILYFSGDKCYNAFEEAANIVAIKASQGPGSNGMKELEKDFNTCSSIESDLDLAVLYSDLMGNVQGTVQYNQESSAMNITDICTIMTESSDYYTNFVKLSATYREKNQISCEDASWNDMIKYLSTTTKDPSNNARPWTYQTCNEFGYYQTTDSKQQPFYAWKELNLNFSRAICAGAFDGWSADPKTEWVDQEYGDLHIAGTNIVFPSGTIDPWHALGITNSTPALPQTSEEPLFILGTAHCNDMYAPASSDPESLTYARQVVAEQVASWLEAK